MLRSKIFKIKIPSVTSLATNAALNVKANEIKNEIPNVTNLATTSAHTTIENKIPNVGDFAKKANYDVKLSEREKMFDYF